MDIYLDNSSTTKPRREVIEIMNKSFTEYYGNPSSLHSMGVKVEKMIKDSRRKVSKALGAKEDEIFFTSGGTESNNIAILGTLEANKRRGKHIITTKIEHPSVLNVFKALEAKGYDITYLNVSNEGIIDIKELEDSLRDDTVLVSIMYVNNEVGSIQPLKEITTILNKAQNRPILHVDGIQAFGKIDINLKKFDIDLFTISGHKFHGPKGIGGLFVRKGTKIQSVFYGGNQELGLRSGTENVHGILGMGVACELVKNELEENIKKMNEVKSKMLYGMKKNIDNIVLNSKLSEAFAPHILNVSFKGIRGEVLLHTLEQKGIFVSTGSACSSRKKEYSHVLTSMGLSEEEMEGSIRFSFNPYIEDEEIEYTIKVLKESVEELRSVINRR